MLPPIAEIAAIRTVIQIVSFADDLIRDLQSAPREWQMLRSQTKRLKIALAALSPAEPIKSASSDLLDSVQTEAEDCIKEMERFATAMQKSSRNGERQVHRIKWVLKKQHFRMLMSNLDRLERSLILLLLILLGQGQFPTVVPSAAITSGCSRAALSQHSSAATLIAPT
ncbi:hypothetical protein BDY19DRAFT_993151 [Irpex rosettiformis]|uniref:Uncharacterized protein n=1 Tax=Irpex rosettiformis TaxID=378272 RepID=A0ACB8U5T1_9APHY|nr:hypothetical protein BDY19DRAFT_993151 [Irpex rosettiformis]